MKQIKVNFSEFNIINKVLLLAGHKELSYDIIKNTKIDGASYVYNATSEDFDLIVKLLIISDDVPESVNLGYNLVNDAK